MSDLHTFTNRPCRWNCRPLRRAGVIDHHPECPNRPYYISYSDKFGCWVARRPGEERFFGSEHLAKAWADERGPGWKVSERRIGGRMEDEHRRAEDHREAEREGSEES